MRLQKRREGGHLVPPTGVPGEIDYFALLVFARGPAIGATQMLLPTMSTIIQAMCRDVNACYLRAWALGRSLTQSDMSTPSVKVTCPRP